MSNILCPIIARYSLFFVLALSDSSRLARSKHPRQAVHELVLKAQQRFQAHYHASATTRKVQRPKKNCSGSCHCRSGKCYSLRAIDEGTRELTQPSFFSLSLCFFSRSFYLPFPNSQTPLLHTFFVMMIHSPLLI